MKRIDLVIWVFMGLTAFLIWNRLFSVCKFTTVDEEWINKTRQSISSGKTPVQVIGDLREAGYGVLYADKIYEQATKNKQ